MVACYEGLQNTIKKVQNTFVSNLIIYFFK